jgi:hypothetical protein
MMGTKLKAVTFSSAIGRSAKNNAAYITKDSTTKKLITLLPGITLIDFTFSI